MMQSRRQFLGEASCAAVGSVSILSTILNLELANRAAAQGIHGAPADRKSLVCMFLSGGCDTYNVLVPTDGDRYAEYAASRSNLAHASGSLQTLDFSSAGETYGVHQNCPKIAQLFNGIGGDAGKRRLSWLANIGTLVERVPNKDAFSNDSVALPKAMFSHRDQTEQWQTSVPQGQTILSGWAGRAADVLHSTFNIEQTGGFYMPMGFSLAGNSTFQTGLQEGQFAITSNGALSFTAPASTSGSPLIDAKNEALRKLMIAENPVEKSYSNLFRQAFADTTGNSIERGEEFQGHYDSVEGNSVDISAVDAGIKSILGLSGSSATVGQILDSAGFPNHWTGNNLRAAAKTICIREQLKLRRQTLFVDYGGWDHHGELLVTQAGMLRYLDDGIYAFQLALEALGLAESVISFSCSDFGRTLRSNGQGTDHAWSGNQFVFGAPVTGGKVLGDFPSLAIDGPDDIGRGGRIFPKLSVDEYFCELLQWFGVSPTDMDSVLPNITNFYDPSSGSKPVGFTA